MYYSENAICIIWFQSSRSSRPTSDVSKKFKTSGNVQNIYKYWKEATFVRDVITSASQSAHFYKPMRCVYLDLSPIILRKEQNWGGGICCFSAKHATLRSKSNDWLVSE